MKLIIAVALCCFAAIAFASDVFVKGYVRKDGTYVAPHHRSAPNSTLMDNYSTQGNVNPYTGQSGHVNPYQQPSYGSHQLQRQPMPSYPVMPSYPQYPGLPQYPSYPQYPGTQ